MTLKHPIFIFAISLFFLSCTDESIDKKLGFNCGKTIDFTNLKSTDDAKNKFSIAIPTNWKKELFVDVAESRLYCADTTKELNNTYIFDLAHYEGNLVLDSAFVKKAKQEILSFSTSKILKTNHLKFQKKTAYSILSSTKNLGFDSQHLLVYVLSNKNSYYVFKADVYGLENVDERFCEALQLFNNVIFKE